MNKKLSAFSITELMVAMCIASVLISIGYQGFMLVSNYYSKQVQQADALSLEKRIMSVVHYDFVCAETLKVSNNSIEFYDGAKNIRYSNFENFMIRKYQTAQDTFPNCSLSLNDEILEVQIADNPLVHLVKQETVAQKIAKIEV